MIFEREKAEQVLAHYWAGKGLPVDPQSIARAAGISLEELPVGDPASGWYVAEQRPRIKFNGGEPPNRVRFTVAHELGHHFLGHGTRPRDTTAAFNLYNRDPVEISANQFAAELLMPARFVRALVVDKGWTSLSELATAFRVSEVAMQYRLKNLGLVS